jgi:peptide/nickel transport system ATP-binding protein
MSRDRALALNRRTNGTIEVTLLEAQHLRKEFPGRRSLTAGPAVGIVAVRDISLTVASGETFAIVGESGSGKTTAARLIMRLAEPTSGRIWFRGRDLTAASRNQLRQERQKIQMIFQDPTASLDPLMSVERTLVEPLRNYGVAKTRGARTAVIANMLEAVGLDSTVLRRRPRDLSGGQKQRVAIARALVLEPDLVVCDEPTASLDGSVQAQILNLLVELQQRRSIAYIVISHDLSVVRHMSDQIGVMYLGQFVETGPASAVCNRPRHPYTEALLSAHPSADPVRERSRRWKPLAGEPPSPTSPPTGCPFHPRCPYRQEICESEAPSLSPTGEGVSVACHFPLSAGGAGSAAAFPEA